MVYQNRLIVMLVDIFTHPVTLAIKPKQASGNSTQEIKTLVESAAGIALTDGSLLTIEENSLANLTEVFKDGKLAKTTVNIQSGKLFFDIQKQKNRNSLEFKTGTATAAIRGTSGFIGQTHRGIMLSLESGKMWVTSVNGETIEVKEGETLIQDGDKGFTKFL